MVRRKPTGWHYSGVAQGRKRRAKPGGWRGALGLLRMKRAGEQRPPDSRRLVSRARLTSPRRRSLLATVGVYSLGLIGWATDRVATKKWRPLSPAEALIWLAVGAVSLAFLALMAQSAFLLAFGIFVLMVVFAWRELGEK